MIKLPFDCFVADFGEIKRGTSLTGRIPCCLPGPFIFSHQKGLEPLGGFNGSTAGGPT